MNFGLTDDQQMMRDMFARFLSENNNTQRVRDTQRSGFDDNLWKNLAELGAFSIRVPESKSGLGLGVFDACLLMEEAGRTLVSGHLAETIVSARLLALLSEAEESDLLEAVTGGEEKITLAFDDVSTSPVQRLAGGVVADTVVARRGQDVVLLSINHRLRTVEDNLASSPMCLVDLGSAESRLLARGEHGIACFEQAIEEWKILVAIALTGMSREAIHMAARYACERVQFGQPIGAYQGVSHPLAKSIVNIDAAKLLAWKTIRDIADSVETAPAQISLVVWWASKTATRAVSHALHTFGGYGLTTEYDIHLYNLHAKSLPLIIGDPERFLEEAGRRLYNDESVVLPDVGDVHINFDLGEEAIQLAQETDDFFRQNLTPELKDKAHYSFDGHDAEIHKKLAQARLLFPAWPKELGGREVQPYARTAAMHVWEKHGWTGHVVAVANMVGLLIHRFGSDELKTKVLSKISSGDVICSLGYSEPASGSDVFAAKTKATRTDRGWRIDGQKMFTSGANIADYVYLLARTDDSGPKHAGLTMFLVPLRAEGVTIQPVYTFQDERTNITFYDGVEVPDSYRIGDVGGGLKVMAASLELEHGGGFSSTQSHMLDAAEQLCREIVTGGRPLIDDPFARNRLARTFAHTKISELLSQRALWVSVEGLPNLGYGPMGKMFSSEKFLQDAADLLDLTAPYSLSKNKGPAGFLNQCYRHSQGTTIYGGTTEIHLSMIAERALGLPRTRA